ncbi:MAG: hypothetical protein ACRDDH_16920 [Cetobacterium sp.]|uniref:hypothetical protein n=1 Tax=Cetobacterium sp. TaxID=2071632 RepID=UPI003EE7BEDD
MEELEELKLSSIEKEKLNNLLTESMIVNLKFLQNKTYIFLMNSNVIVLNNSTKQIYDIFEKIKKKMSLEIQKYNYKKDVKRLIPEWTDSEKEYLKENYFKESLENLEILLRKSYYQISLKVIELGLILNREWEEKELEFLKENIDMSNYVLAQMLRRTFHSIKAKKRVLLEKQSRKMVI